MALQKDITLENGITLSYHRIAEIQNIINDNTKLKVISYINKEQRSKEVLPTDYSLREDIYKLISFEELPYNDTLTIQEAYDYLKTIEKYSDAEDVFEVENNNEDFVQDENSDIIEETDNIDEEPINEEEIYEESME